MGLCLVHLNHLLGFKAVRPSAFSSVENETVFADAQCSRQRLRICSIIRSLRCLRLSGFHLFSTWTGEKVTRRVYSAEELHRLRGSCSQPKLHEAIEEHDGDDAELVKGKSFANHALPNIIGKQHHARDITAFTFANY